MTRNFFLTLTAALPLVTAACGDNGGGTEGASTSGASTGETTGGTTTTTPTTSGEPETTTGMSSDTTTGDPATTDAPTTTTGEPATTTGPDLTTTTDVTATTTTDGTTTSDDTTTGGDPVQQCIMMLDDPNDECGQCACSSCTMELQTCQADEGCTAIRECAQESMCGGIDCLGPCGDTINKYGGFMGESAGKAIALGNCISDSCAMECGG